MQILNWLPPHAQQIRYIHPHYEYQEDEDGNVVDEWLANEETCTNVWEDVVQVVKRTKRPIYFRRRTSQIAKDMVGDYSARIMVQNSSQSEWDPDNRGCYPVRVKRLGKRVIFLYDEEYTFIVWNKDKKTRATRIKIRNLKQKELFKEQPNHHTEEHPIPFTMEKLDSMLEEWVDRADIEEYEGTIEREHEL
tara:strand:- start:38 stop:613 length:576 start_codon:yes stop_codon:yes gene_type:complete